MVPHLSLSGGFCSRPQQDNEQKQLEKRLYGLAGGNRTFHFRISAETFCLRAYLVFGLTCVDGSCLVCSTSIFCKLGEFTIIRVESFDTTWKKGKVFPLLCISEGSERNASRISNCITYCRQERLRPVAVA